MQYWDTSTLLKLYVLEADSPLFRAHINPPIHTSQLAQWELLRAITRKEMERGIPVGSTEAVFEQFLADIKKGHVLLLPMSAETETQFRELVLRLHRNSPPVVIRTLDAIHLATAELLSASEVVTTDPRMRTGAIAIGLKVFP